MDSKSQPSSSPWSSRESKGLAKCKVLVLLKGWRAFAKFSRRLAKKDRECARGRATNRSMRGDQMSDGGWRRGDVKPSNPLLEGAITRGDALMLP
jgi:hypothetical protein